MSTEDLERYEAEIELQLYKEYKDSRFVQSVQIVTFRDINVEELPPKEI
jgi:hypothetical protein